MPRPIKRCSIEDCGRIHSGRGFCKTHYDKNFRLEANRREATPAYRLMRARQNSERRETGYTKDWGLRRNYGISLEEFKEMIEIQSGLCAICTEPMTTHILYAGIQYLGLH